MGARQKAWARKKRQQLLELLGGECVLCKTRGRVKHPGGLEFDVILPVDYGDHHAFDTSQRMSFYWHEFKRGNLQLLCSFHNAAKGTKDKQWLQLQQANNPF